MFVFLIIIFGQVICVNSQHVFVDRTTLVTAVDAWVADETSATTTYGTIDSWDVSRVNDMSRLFEDKDTFNDDISGWNVSSSTAMYRMFSHASAFNRDIGNWDVRSVTNMMGMFSHASAFNQDISGWDVYSVTDMSNMFWNTSVFNYDLDGWDVSSVNNMTRMFYQAAAFNQDISTWNVSGVTSMARMFEEATSFSQRLCWNVTGKDTTDMFIGSNGGSICGQPTQQPTSSLSERERTLKNYVEDESTKAFNGIGHSIEDFQSVLRSGIRKFRDVIRGEL